MCRCNPISYYTMAMLVGGIGYVYPTIHIPLNDILGYVYISYGHNILR